MEKKQLLRGVLLLCAIPAAACYASDHAVIAGVFQYANGKAQEDTYVATRIKYQCNFLGVYDGHGGDRASRILQQNLHLYFSEYLRSHGPDKNIKEAFWSTFQKAEEVVLADTTAGSTAVVAYVTRDLLHVAWVGDSRLIVGNSDGTVFATQDHDFKRADELERVVRAGGIIFRKVAISKKAGAIVQQGDLRVNGLGMTRSIGDRPVKGKRTDKPLKFGTKEVGNVQLILELYPDKTRPAMLEVMPCAGQVISDPDYAEIVLTKDHRWLILGSDGLFDFVANEEAIDLAVRSAARNKFVTEIARILGTLAITRGSKDNVTVVVYDLLSRHQKSLII